MIIDIWPTIWFPSKWDKQKEKSNFDTDIPFTNKKKNKKKILNAPLNI